MAPRVAELRARQAEIEDTLAKVIPIHKAPAHLYSDASIAKFRTQIRDLFLSGDNALTRNYLCFLVERITVTDNRIDLTARSESAVQMIAAVSDEKSPADLFNRRG